MIVEALVAAAVSGLAPKALELFWNGRRSEAPPQPVIQIHTHFDSSDPYNGHAPVSRPPYAPYTPLGTYDIAPKPGVLEAGFLLHRGGRALRQRAPSAGGLRHRDRHRLRRVLPGVGRRHPSTPEAPDIPVMLSVA